MVIEPPCTERYARWCERSGNHSDFPPTRLPPMTKYLYAAYSSKLKSDFEEQIVLFLEKFENVEFLDLGCDSHFTDDDFGDFEHLNHNGGIKLTSILSEKLINSQRKENDA